ncbi:MAG: efflux RND transporter periplasmic adaptor subunit [bacterium]
MKRYPWPLGLGVLIVLALGWLLGRCSAPEASPAGHAHGTAEGMAAEATVYTCSMHPQIRRDAPGLCPICGMELVAAGAAGAAPDPRTLTLSPHAAALARIRTAPVERREVERTLRLVGKIAYDPTRLHDITAWFPGRIERMFVDYQGMRIREGDHLYEIYSPALVAAHEELRVARRALDRLGAASETVRESAARTLDAVRSKLRRWGLSKRQVERLEGQGRAPDRVTIYAPAGGVVIEQAKLEGSYVETGTRLYRIADLDWVWLEAWAYEQHLPWIRFGQAVTFRVEAVPGRVFEGRVAGVDPYLDDAVRAARVRISVQNADGLLKPGMFAQVTLAGALAGEGHLMEPALAGKWVCPMHPHVIEDGEGRCPVCGMRLVEAEALGYGLPDPDAPPPLVIPRTAPLLTGARAVVYVEEPDAPEPTYTGRVVELGPEAGEWYVVEAGLTEGERVVVEGAFKLDASLQIEARPSMMNPAADEPPPSAPVERVVPAAPVKTGKDSPMASPKPSKASAKASKASPESAPAPSPLPPPVIEGTLALAAALAADDAAAAARAHAALTTALAAAAPAPGLDAAALAALRDALRADGDGIDGHRAALGRYSDRLIPLLRATPALAGREVTVYHCPMAPKYTRGEWLQATAPLQNPWFGARMLRCGTRRDLIAGGVPQ